MKGLVNDSWLFLKHDCKKRNMQHLANSSHVQRYTKSLKTLCLKLDTSSFKRFVRVLTETVSSGLTSITHMIHLRPPKDEENPTI